MDIFNDTSNTLNIYNGETLFLNYCNNMKLIFNTILSRHDHCHGEPEIFSLFYGWDIFVYIDNIQYKYIN